MKKLILIITLISIPVSARWEHNYYYDRSGYYYDPYYGGPYYEEPGAVGGAVDVAEDTTDVAEDTTDVAADTAAGLFGGIF